MQPLKKFKPTEEQIRAAENVLVAMAHEQTIRPIVEQYEQEILAKHQFPMASEWVEKGIGPRVILDRKMAYLLSEADSAIYHRECNEARVAAKLTVTREGNCPLCEAEYVRIQAENALIQAMSTLPGLDGLSKGVMTLELRARAIDLMLKLMAPFVDRAATILNRFGVVQPA